MGGARGALDLLQEPAALRVVGRGKDLVLQTPQPRAVTLQAAGYSWVEATTQDLSSTEQLQLGHHHPPVPSFQALWGVPIQAPSPSRSAPFAPFPELGISFKESQRHGQQ